MTLETALKIRDRYTKSGPDSIPTYMMTDADYRLYWDAMDRIAEEKN